MSRSSLRAPEVSRVIRHGKPFIGERVILYVGVGAGRARRAFVTRRGVGTAVARNRARRILREAWEEVAPFLREPMDVVLVARPGIRGAKSYELTSEIRDLLSKAELIQ